MAPFKPGSTERKKPNISRAAHVFAEADANGEEALIAVRKSFAVGEIPAPTLIVQSSPHKYHFIWNVVGFTAPAVEAMNRALEQKFGTDSVSDVARVLRIPGFYNIKAKYGKTKPMATIIEYNQPPATGITISDFKIPLENERTAVVLEPAQPRSEDPLAAIIDAIPDEKLIERIKASEQGKKFTKLMDGECPQGYFKASNSLCAILAWWTHNNPERIDRIYKTSRLYTDRPLDGGPTGPEWWAESVGAGITRGSKTIALMCAQTKIGDMYQPPAKTAQIEVTEIVAPVQKVEERLDIPRAVLSGRLGEMCEREMLDDFPVSYGWPSLITAASVLVPEQPATASGENLHNLYTALVGPVNCGKSQAIEWALQLLRIKDDVKRYNEVKPGSAERLLRYMNRLAADGGLGPRVLMSLDEWKFFFDKAAIENSIFPTLLTTGFYRRNTTILDSHGHPLTVPAAFSWIGGIVTESYDDCLSQVTSLGLHDRLLQGINPSNYSGFNYRPFEGQMIPADFEPQPVQIDKSVWECLKAWKGTNPQATREAEIARRVAEICASFDGAPILYGKDLGPHLILADEQRKLRAILKPNIGETPDAQCAIKVENYLQAHGPACEWLDFRAMMKAIHYEKYGPNVFKRTIEGLVHLKIVELGERPATAGNHAGGRAAKAIRLVLD
jgi:hypothetical protein